MGLILAPDEIRTNMEVLRSYLNSMTECYQNVLERVYEYYDEEDLDTESFRESKNQMAICYRLIAEGMVSVQESVTGDIDTLLGCIGDEYLDEDELNAQIERLQAQCEQYEQRIKNMQVMKFFLGALSVHGVIEYYQKMIENCKAQIAVLLEKLFFLREAEDLTVNLFQLAMDSLTTVQNVIRDAGVNVREGSFPTKLVWLTELNDIEGLEEIDDFESNLVKQGFPEGYIKYLLILHEEYPEWKFEAVTTGIDYNSFLSALIDAKCKCAEVKAYCSENIFELEKSYYIANDEAMQFFLNPYSLLQANPEAGYRNALQFLKVNQDLPQEYIDMMVPKILLIEEDTASDEEKEIIKAIKTADSCVNPIILAIIYAGENGPKGEECNGKKVYNFFNIGADTGREAARQYAYDQGWFSLEKCIEGSNEVLEEYINAEQDTLYAMDWNFPLYAKKGEIDHQYAALVNDTEDKILNLCIRKGEVLDLHQEFILKIPVYENVSTYGDEEYGAYPDPNKQ